MTSSGTAVAGSWPGKKNRNAARFVSKRTRRGTHLLARPAAAVLVAAGDSTGDVAPLPPGGAPSSAGAASGSVGGSSGASSYRTRASTVMSRL